MRTTETAELYTSLLQSLRKFRMFAANDTGSSYEADVRSIMLKVHPFQIGLLDDDLTIVGTHRAGSLDMSKGTPTFATFSPPRLPQQQPRSCVVFCFMEKRATKGLLSTKSLGPDELTAALLAEDEKPSDKSAIDENLRLALSLCHRYRLNANFKEGVLLKTVESESECA